MTNVIWRGQKVHVYNDKSHIERGIVKHNKGDTKRGKRRGTA